MLSVRRRIGTMLVAVLATSAFMVGIAGSARAATTSFDRTRTILFNGEPTFPIVLSPGPPLGGQTPWGTDGLTETAFLCLGCGETWPLACVTDWGGAP